MGEAVGLPSGGFSVERNPGEAGALSSQRVYDPLWTNARAFLDYAAGADLIERDASKAAIGQLVLVTGSVWVVDSMLLKAISTGPHMRKLMGADTRAPSGPRQAKAAGPSDVDMALELVHALPTTVQGRFLSGQDQFWGSLIPEGLTSSPGDLMLKHGIQIAGQWSTVGILDATPDTTKSEVEQAIDQVKAMAALGAVMGGIGLMASHLRPMLGRPTEAYGITPLLVFREVAGRG